MRFSSRNVLAALPAVIAAAVLPSTSDHHGFHTQPRSNNASPDGSTFVFLDPSYNQPNVVFSVPCAGCAYDDALLFNFRAFPSEEACGVANVTINGQALDQTWNGTHGIGAGNLESLPYSSQWRLFPHHLDLSFESSCLPSSASEPSDLSTPSSHTSPAQIFTVTIQSVDGQPVEGLSGFTISFRPQVPLELLRLSAIPDLAATRQPINALWHNPPEDLRLPYSHEASVEDNDTPAEENVNPPSLDEFERELERIFAERHQNDELLKKAYKAAKEEDMREGYQAGSPTNREVIRLMEEMQRLEDILIKSTNSLIQEHSQDTLVNPPGTVAPECHSVRCLIDKFFHDARNVLEKFIMKIKPNFALSQRPGSQQISLDTEPPYRDDDSKTPTLVSSVRPAVTTRAATSATASTNTPHFSNNYFRLGDGVLDSIDPLTLTLKIVGAITGLTCILVLFRRSACCCPQARAERRAQQEQRRTERQYRRAARTLQIQKWWSRWTGWRRDTQRIHDYEEKRALIREQEGLLENVMQDEIRLLRAAHDAVNSIISASDRGSIARTTPIPIMTQHRLPQHQQNYVPDVEAWQNVPLSRTNSLPDYRSDAGSSHFSSEPPAYSDDEGDIVTDGFRGYRGGDVSADDSDTEPLSPVLREQRRWSPGSSVISTSPRPSQETMRFLVR